MAWRGQQELINPANLLTRQQHLNEDWIFKDLIRAMPTTEAAILFCAKHQLLANTSTCQNCNISRSIFLDQSVPDGIIWKCTSCESKKFIRSGSFFERSKLSLEQILLFSYGWARDWPFKDCNIESGGMAAHTQVDWGNFMRNICEDDIRRHSCIVGGFDIDANGTLTPKVVEIDESILSKAKYHRGRHPRERWVFGGIERGSRACFMVEVPDRTRPTLEAEIANFILPGTHIISDGWASYTDIDQIGGGVYTHDVIIHDQHFVDPTDPDIHTQNVENN